MTSVEFDPKLAARRLAPLWAGFDQLDQLPPAERPADMDQAYTLQRALADELGEPVRGYKLGLSSEAAIARSGLGGPIMGFVPASRLFHSGSSIPLPPSGKVLFEAEVALVIEVEDSGIAAVNAHLVFEIVRSRFIRRADVDMPSFVGDASGFHALVVGDTFSLDTLGDLLATGASIWQDGRRVADSLAGSERPDPIATLARFVALVDQHKFAATSGMIVATGSLVVPYETDAKGPIEARLGPCRVSTVLT